MAVPKIGFTHVSKACSPQHPQLNKCIASTAAAQLRHDVIAYVLCVHEVDDHFQPQGVAFVCSAMPAPAPPQTPRILSRVDRRVSPSLHHNVLRRSRNKRFNVLLHSLAGTLDGFRAEPGDMGR